MSSSIRTCLLLAATCLLFTGTQEIHAESRIGAGVNYWTAIDDLSSDIDDSGFSYLISYQARSGLLSLEIDGEILPDRFGKDAYAPQAYLLVGSGIYAGVGIGIEYIDGDFEDDPFFALRAGLNLEILPQLYLDLNANYRFSGSKSWSELEQDIDTDTVFLGGAVRLGF